MAKLRLTGDTSGYIEIQAPDAAGSNTLVLPTSNGSANQFLRNGSTAGTLQYSSMIEDSSGRIGLNSSLSGAAAYNRLVINSPDNSCWVSLQSAQTGSTINSDGMDIGLNGSNQGHVWLRENADLAIATNNSEKLRVLAGGGLTFNGDTAAANALDDYEEGTWTVTVLGTISNPTVSIGYQMNRYVKVGGVVHFYSNFQGTMSGGSGSFYIAGLPYTPQNTNWMPVSLAYTNVNGTAAPGAAMVQANTQTVYFWGASGADARSNVNTQTSIANIGTYFDIYIGGSYMTY